MRCQFGVGAGASAGAASSLPVVRMAPTEAATILRQCLGLSAEDIEGMSVADIAEELDTLVVSNEDIWRALNAKLSVPTSTTEDTEGIQVRELR